MSDDTPQERVFCIRIPFGTIQRNNPAIVRLIQLYEAIAALSVPSEVEESLVWKISNHHTFGKKFTQYIEQQIREKLLKDGQIVQHVDREHQAVIYHHTLPVEDYRKYSSLICSLGTRYLLTTITRKKYVDSIYLLEIADALYDNRDFDARLRKLAHKLSPIFMRLREYKQGALITDKEVRK